jgi:hypothetical protein
LEEINRLEVWEEVSKTPTYLKTSLCDSFSSAYRELITQETSNPKCVRDSITEAFEENESGISLEMSDEDLFEHLYNGFNHTDEEQDSSPFREKQRIDILYKSAIRMIRRFYLEIFPARTSEH